MTDYGYGTTVGICFEGVCLDPLVHGFDEFPPETVLPVLFEDSQSSELVIVTVG